ncbi:MAG: hypothetical protein HY720_23765 [Planctomycetes bacterium]|nr:hypothetical protein [Planctomycetota bacterium]
MKQITIRDVPEDLARALAEEKERRRKSLNQTVLDLLHGALGLAPGSAFDNGLGDLAGSWNEEDFRQFEGAISMFEQIDEELWR